MPSPEWAGFVAVVNQDASRQMLSVDHASRPSLFHHSLMDTELNACFLESFPSLLKLCTLLDAGRVGGISVLDVLEIEEAELGDPGRFPLQDGPAEIQHGGARESRDVDEAKLEGFEAIRQGPEKVVDLSTMPTQFEIEVVRPAAVTVVPFPHTQAELEVFELEHARQPTHEQVARGVIFSAAAKDFGIVELQLQRSQRISLGLVQILQEYLHELWLLDVIIFRGIGTVEAVGINGEGTCLKGLGNGKKGTQVCLLNVICVAILQS